MTSTLQILGLWNADEYETRDSTPSGGEAALLVWREPERVDAGPGPGLALALLEAMTPWGELMFRVPAPVPAGLRSVGIVSRRSGLSSKRWAIAGASAPEAALVAFDEGWKFGDQIVAAGLSDARAAGLIFATDARGFALSEDELALIAGVDGAVAVVAAGSAEHVRRYLSLLCTRLRTAGWSVAFDPDAERFRS